MDYEPKTEDELALEGLMPEGEYDAEIMLSEDALSKKGQDMFKLKVRVWDANGAERHMYDYVSPHFMAWKFRHLHASAGLLEVYEKGSTNADQLCDKTVRVAVGVEGAKDGYPPKNKITDYLVPTEATKVRVKAEGPPKAGSDDDDLPF